MADILKVRDLARVVAIPDGGYIIIERDGQDPVTILGSFFEGLAAGLTPSQLLQLAASIVNVSISGDGDSRTLTFGRNSGQDPLEVVIPVGADSGIIPVSRLPAEVVLESEFTAVAIRNLLGLTAAEQADFFKGATISGRVITITQEDDSTIDLTLPAAAVGGEADGVVQSGAFDADGDNLVLTLSDGSVVNIDVPSWLDTAGINTRIDQRITGKADLVGGKVPVSQIPDEVMLDSEFTAAAIRTLLGLTAAEQADFFKGATITGRVITITQEDDSIVELTLPPSGEGADGVVSSGVFDATGDNLELTLSDGTVITIDVPSWLDTAGINARIDQRITGKADLVGGKVPVGQIPDEVMLDNEFTAAAIRNLLGLTAAEQADFFKGATISGRVITITQEDDSTIDLTLPVDMVGMEDGVVESGSFNAAGDELTLVVDGADDVVISVPALLRTTVIQFLAENEEFPAVVAAAADRIYVKSTGDSRIRGKTSTNPVGPQASVADWVQATYRGEGAGDASAAAIALAAEHDYYYDTTTERFRQQIADGTIDAVDARNEILPDNVTLLSNGSFIAGAGRYANHQAAIDYLDESFHEQNRPQVTTFTSWVYFDEAESDMRVITAFSRSIAAVTTDALIPLDSGAIVSLALGDPQLKPDYSIWNFLGHQYRVVPTRHPGHAGSVDFADDDIWTVGQVVTNFWPAGTGGLVFRGIHENPNTIPNAHSGDISVTPSGAWNRFYLFRHAVPSGWYSHDPPEGWIGLRNDEADAEAHTFQDNAIVLYDNQVRVSSNYVAADPQYVTRRYEPVVKPISVYGQRIAYVQFKATMVSSAHNSIEPFEADEVGTAADPIGWTIDASALDGVARVGDDNDGAMQLTVPRLRPHNGVTGFIGRVSVYPILGGHISFDVSANTNTLNFSTDQTLDPSVNVGDKVRVNEEIMYISDITLLRTSCTVVRAQDGTDAVIHRAPWFVQGIEWVSPYDEVDFEWGPGNIFNQGAEPESVNPLKVGPRQGISVRYISQDAMLHKYMQLKHRDTTGDRRVPPSTLVEIFLKVEN